MKIILDSADLKNKLKNVRNLGFVPTMGSIHKGHESLIKRSKNESNKTLVSIFINPTQFNNKKDLKNYPKNLKKDLSILKKLKVDYIFLPKVDDVYRIKRRKKIKLNKTDLILCAKSRKGHFEGVLDVMDRLTKLISPNKIFMGEKDYQQYHLVKRFLKMKYKVKIIKCRTLRSSNNVALSSRNLLLGRKDLFTVGKITKELIRFKKVIKNSNTISKNLILKKNELLKKFKIKIEYLELRNIGNLKKTNSVKNSKIFIAYYLNEIRLIDNL
jgi:pantoate--beta-alanine ligase